MGKVERIIIDATKGYLVQQVEAAHAAITAGINEGETYGLRRAERYFGVRRNKVSVRVYPQWEAE
jgi:hypothetical protein